MASSTSKKVTAIRFDREPVNGFVNQQTWLQAEGIELLTATGSLSVLPYTDLKAVCFVRDFASGATWRPNRVFAVRPKSEGLWVRFRFRDRDTIQGLVPGNLLALEADGFTITPPDAAPFASRVYLPRASVVEAQVLGVIGGVARRAARPKTELEDQLKMFE